MGGIVSAYVRLRQASERQNEKTPNKSGSMRVRDSLSWLLALNHQSGKGQANQQDFRDSLIIVDGRDDVCE